MGSWGEGPKFQVSSDFFVGEVIRSVVHTV